MAFACFEHHKGQYSHADYHVQHVNAREDVVIHEEIVAGEGIAFADLGAPLEILHHTEAKTAEEGEEEQSGRQIGVALADEMQCRSDEPGTGEQKNGIDRAQILIEQSLSRIEALDIKVSVIEEHHEKYAEYHHVADDEDPDPHLTRQMSSVLQTGGWAYFMIRS